MARIGGLSVSVPERLKPRKGATRSTGQVQRGVTRPAAAVRQPGAEMNETYGMSTSEGISQDNQVLNFYPDFSLIMQVWLLYSNLSLDMQV